MSDLEHALGYHFVRSELLAAALVHRSYTAEHSGVEDNERLEFLGDAVLQLVVTDRLFERHQELAEGEMAKVRAACVNRTELAVIARELGVGPFLKVGAGEAASGGKEKTSLLADAMEAILAAIYLDGGLEAARSVILTHWDELIARKALEPGHRDFKTRLQEVLATSGRRPVYAVEGDGPDHARVFTAEVSVDGTVVGRGSGRSKKEAEQRAAEDAISRSP